MKSNAGLLLALATILHFWTVAGAHLRGSMWRLGKRSGVNAAAAPYVDQATLQLIQHLEDFTDNFTVTKGVKKIGFGHDCNLHKDCATIRPPITMDEGTELLLEDLAPAKACVCKLPNSAKLSANQVGALTSFTFSSGCSRLSKSFASVVRKGNSTTICRTLATSNMLNGQLTLRRQEEATFCSRYSYDENPCTESGNVKIMAPPASVPMQLELRFAKVKREREAMVERERKAKTKKSKVKRTKLNKAQSANEVESEARDVAVGAVAPMELYWRRCRWCRRGWGYGD